MTGIAFLGEGGEDQLAALAVGQRLAGGRVDDLGEEVVLEDVQAVPARSHSTDTPGPMISLRP